MCNFSTTASRCHLKKKFTYYISEAHFCGIILNLDLTVIQEEMFMIFLRLSLETIFFCWAESICAILSEGIIGNICVKLLFWLWTTASKDVI